jgi:4-hydroxy-tetrahydrodipicolinate reductase
MNSKKSPKIALIGHGSMGKEIESLAREKNYEITEIFEIDKTISPEEEYEFDVAIDFSYPEAVMKNIEVISKLKKNLVIGTTGWYDDIEKARSLVENTGTGLVYGTNFSIGMRMFFKIIDEATKLMNKSDDYDIFMHEMHHHRKKDSPSGTAETLADIILGNVEKKTEKYTETMHGRIKPKQLHISSTRGGEIMGYHKIYIDSLADTIELAHRAKNRSGFAMGALTAAEWIHGKSGFFDFGTVLENIWLNK